MTISRENAASILNSDQCFLTFAGTETFLLFQQGFPLRNFCAFEALEDNPAWRGLERELLVPILDAAAESGMGLLTDSLCWRASSDALARLGYAPADVDRFNRLGIQRVGATVELWRASRGISERELPVVLAAEIGPRGDGYDASGSGEISIGDAWDCHLPQIISIAQTGAHLAVALTMTNLKETIGLALVAKDLGLPIAISPTVETDGRLPDGSSLASFIQDVDTTTDGYPAFYMVNCAHPNHLAPTLAHAKAAKSGWLQRLRGFRANASCKSHAELDNATELDRGDIASLAAQVARLARQYHFNILGGCCGTDAKHLRAIARASVRKAELAATA